MNRGGKARSAKLGAKYKAERTSGYPNADVYQALAYATALGLPDAHLVYARGNEPVSSSLIRGSGVRVDAHAIDLALPPADLLSQISGLARTMTATARGRRSPHSLSEANAGHQPARCFRQAV